MICQRTITSHGTIGWLLAGLMVLTSACGARDGAGNGEPAVKAKVSYTVNRPAWRLLEKAQQALAEKDYKAAREELDDMKAQSRRWNPYELALMWQTYAHLYAEEQNLAGAADALEKALIGETLPEGALLDAMYNLGSLQAASEQFEKASGNFERWLELAGDKATISSRYNVGIIYAQAKHFEKALEQAKFIVAAEPDPAEEHMKLLLSVHYELGNMGEVERLLKRLLVRYPRKQYWQQLAGLYSKKDDQARALAVWELMHIQGLLESSEEVTRLAQTLVFRGIPTKAIAILNDALKRRNIKRNESTLDLLATAYIFARESADAKTVLAEAAKMSAKGQLYIELGRQQLRDAEWDAAVTSVKRGIAKGGIAKVGIAYLLLGTIYYNAEQWRQAQAAFQQAATYAESSETAARWQIATRQQLQSVAGRN